MLASLDAYADAIPHFQQSLQMQPASYSASYNLALAYKRAGNSESAIQTIEQALMQRPTGELYDLLASLEEDAGRYVEAARHYQQAVQLEPTNEHYYFDLGAEYLVHLTFGPALEVFRVGSQKFPKSPRQYVGMGLAQFALRQYAEAAEAFLSALEIDPSSPDAFAAWNALPTFVAVDDWNRIKPRLQQLAERNARSAQALYCYGAAVFRHSVTRRGEDFGLAQSLLERTIRLKPKFGAAHLELASLYAARKENEKAVASFLEAIRLEPDSDIAHYRLGQAYRNMHKLELAERELARYVELSRSHQNKAAQTKSAIRQFVLTQPDSAPPSTGNKPPL
jgi:tetratricopeptide (TPR) repeat protein